MGRGDNKRTLKMRRKKAQTRKKLRAKKVASVKRETRKKKK